MLYLTALLHNKRASKYSRLSLSALFAIFLASCASMSDYQKPELATTQPYNDDNAFSFTEVNHDNVKQDVSHNKLLEKQWWALFKSAELNTIIEQAIAGSPELQIAQATMKQAQANFEAEKASHLPKANLTTGVTRQKFSGASVGFPDESNTIFNLYDLSIDLSYNIDLFDKDENITLVAKNSMIHQQLKQQSTYLTLIANVVNQYIQLAAFADELDNRKQILQIEQQRLALLKAEALLGGYPKAALLSQQDQVSQAQIAVATIEKNYVFSQHQLAILMGLTPVNKITSIPSLTQLQLPNNLPLSLPSQLVNQRVDIQLAQNMINTRYAQLGIAVANQLPQITLSGSYGVLSQRSSTLFDPASIIWNAAAGLTQPLFNSGELALRETAALGALEESRALYQQTVLAAFQQVEDSLSALSYDAKMHAQASDYQQRRKNELAIKEQEQALGMVSKLAVLSIKQQHFEANISRINHSAKQLLSTVALFQALGGGWSIAPE